MVESGTTGVPPLDASVELTELLDAIPHIAWMTGADGIIRYINARWFEYTGVDGLDMQAIAEAIHPEDLPNVTEQMESARATGLRNEYELRIRSKAGEYRWHRVKALPMRGSDGAVKCWIGTSTDVHEEHLAFEALRESEADYRFLIDSNPQVPWTADPNGVLTDFSDRWLRMTGLSREEALSSGWTEVPHPEDLPFMLEAFGNAIQTNAPLAIEHRARMANGEYRWMKTQAFPRLNEAGEVLKWFGTTEDIHDRKVAEDALHSLNESLERKVQERTRELEDANRKLSQAYREAEAFSYTASHDLRTPLRAVISNSRMLIADFGDALPAEGRKMLDDQAAAAKRMAALIDELLNHSRIGRAELVRQELDLTAIACALLPELENRNPAVKIVVEPGLKANADPHLLPMVLQNLLENAVLYSPNGGIVRFGRKEDCFFVADQGIGFDMEYSHRIFEPFERLHGYGEYPGTGIGLANVKKIIGLHGGEIWVESQVGKGSTFFFTLA